MLDSDQLDGESINDKPKFLDFFDSKSGSSRAIIHAVIAPLKRKPKTDWGLWPTVKDGERIHRSDTNLIYQYDEAANTWFIVED